MGMEGELRISPTTENTSSVEGDSLAQQGMQVGVSAEKSVNREENHLGQCLRSSGSLAHEVRERAENKPVAPGRSKWMSLSQTRWACPW